MSAALRGAGRATAPLLVAVLAAVGMAGCQLLRPAFAPQPRVPVRTGAVAPAYLISTPTMTASSEDISDTLNVALACAAAFQAVHMQNAREPGK